MDSKCGDNRVTLAVEFFLLAEKCNRKQSVTDAMDFAGFTEAEIRSSGRAKKYSPTRSPEETPSLSWPPFSCYREMAKTVCYVIGVLQDLMSTSNHVTFMCI